MARQIVHINVPNFPLQMETLRWRNLYGRPVVLVPALRERARVQVLSPEAERNGICRGMLLSTAKRLCRELVALPFDERYYQSGSDAVFVLASRMSPMAEPGNNWGRAYVDLSYLAAHGERVQLVCRKMLAELQQQLGLCPALGLAGNKLVSLIASRRAPDNELCQIAPGEEQRFLHPLPAHYLPAVDAGIWCTLKRMGLQRVGVLAQLTADDLAVLFGHAGVRLYEQAHGRDYAPVVPPRPARGRSFGEVLVPDTNDVEVLHGKVARLAELAGVELRARGLQARRLALELEYADARRVTARMQLRVPSAREAEIRAAFLQLLDRVLKRRVRVRALLVQLCESVPATRQLSLFSAPPEHKHRKLETALDAVRGRFGEKVIGYARTLP